ncbi:ATPase synthesis protein 25, mitochondrial [Aspergillus melleus]|uniref:ATPase synthesis protein 25, mitochondrial n=1 Tax=Aspergillus melleus TaxID=138277 RepID=UPI001E8CBB3D|nr:ATPase synthesis protein 25, mitochondrial [Aspergillus melleus]KAH8429450.1 ATPase synthesis protein 25, mitochondrial [Aspergillus melleus]
MNRVVLRPWCRPEVFRSVYTPGASIPRRAFPAQSIYNANGRHFASVSRWHNKQSPETPPASTPELSEASNAALENETTSSSPHVPWYLQEASPVSESQISSRDQLPDLPEQSPEILPVLLEYVFKDLGLDNLNLIDLRPLETPPPLGANVIMIIGTARSVKHLNVSADRLCRWLRSKWKLSPYADGLLGRNELKIKLRRKARRARIASQSGTMVDEKDDGITTGWICVNAGVVEKSAAPEPGAQNFEGFGTVVGGTRVVVQMFTEEKRAEVDLEGLWQKTLDRAEREKKKYAEANPSSPPKEVRSSSSTNPSPSSSSSHSDLDFGHPTRTPVTPPFGQRRQIHSGRPRIPCQAMQGTANTPILSPFRSSVRGYSSSQESDLVNALLQYLSGLSDEQVQKDLGTGPDDTSSTPFLQLFHGNISRFFEHEKEFAKLKLYCTAIYRHHPGYSKLGLAKTFEYHAALGRVIPDDLSFEIVSALLAGQPTDEPAEGGGVKMTLPREDIEVALDVLEHLSTQGTNLMNLKMFNIIYKAAMIIPDQVQPQTKTEKEAEAEEPTSRLSDQDKITSSALYRVSRMIDAFEFPFDATETRLHMALRFQAQDYDGFWKIWRQLPIHDQSRTQKDYEMMFEAHARLGDPVLAESCLTEWFPMMSREKYPIQLEGQLRESVLECILLADPDVKKNSMNQLNRPMVRIWNECHQRREAQQEFFY